MRWTSQSEKEVIKEWAKECSTADLTDQYFSTKGVQAESYWCKHNEGNEIVDYDFNTVPELKAILEQELKETIYEDLLLPLTIAAFKEKTVTQINAETDEKDNGTDKILEKDELTIPEFVYVF